MNRNIAYQTDELARYFVSNRIAWEQFYDSERAIFAQLNLNGDHQVLDIGCGCGGLGIALRDRFGVRNYTGVEINRQAVEVARKLYSEGQFFHGDILKLSREILHGRSYDFVFSLSCVDWNIQFSDMLAAAWDHVRPGGYLVSTFRITVEDGCNDFDRSYQYINCDGSLEGERAAYVVLNASALFKTLATFGPSEINGHGYWGAPSATAVTPYDRLCFAAFSIRKRTQEEHAAPICALDLPSEIREAMIWETR